MSIKMRGIAAAMSAFIALAMIATVSFADTPAKSIKDQLVGHWQLVSITMRGSSPYGANPEGSMFLDAAGHYSVIILSDGGARSVSFFGTYTVDDADSTITFHVIGSSRPTAGGKDEKRIVSLSGDELTEQKPPSPGPIGALSDIKVIWKRS